MSFALERMIAPAIGAPALPFAGETDAKLNVTVVFTSVEATLAALKTARGLLGEQQAGSLSGQQACSLGGRITLIVPQIVPYPLPLASSPVLFDNTERRLRVIAGQSRIDTRVCVYLCRDSLEALKSVLKPHSVVIVGTRKKWWPSAEKRLAAKLRSAGHEVIVTERE